MNDKFSKIYPSLKPSVVAIASRLSKNPELPDIIGTGFIARADGIIFTNNHVIQAIKKLSRLKSMGPEDWPIVVLYFHWVPDKGMMIIDLEVKRVGGLKREKPVEGYNYGPDIPDLGFIHVHIKDLPALKIAEKLDLNEGEEVMLAGFPMGTDTLRAPGWLHQLTPTLQSGIISAILPFPCDNPHAMLLNIMTQGGSSGSPVFNPSTGEVIGIEYAGIVEPKTLSGKSGIFVFEDNTSLTFAIPAKIVHEIYQKINEVEEFKNADVSKFDTIESLIAKKEVKIRPPKTPTMRAVSPDEILKDFYKK
jgi:S1-C subfamily serine protease